MKKEKIFYIILLIIIIVKYIHAGVKGMGTFCIIHFIIYKLLNNIFILFICNKRKCDNCAEPCVLKIQIRQILEEPRYSGGRRCARFTKTERTDSGMPKTVKFKIWNLRSRFWASAPNSATIPVFWRCPNVLLSTIYVLHTRCARMSTHGWQ